MPDTLSISPDSLPVDTLADSLHCAADTAEPIARAFSEDYSLTDSLLALNVATANGIKPPIPPYVLAEDDTIVITLTVAFLLMVLYVVSLRLQGDSIRRAWSVRGGEMNLAQPPKSTFGIFLLTAGLSLGVLAVGAVNGYGIILPSPFDSPMWIVVMTATACWLTMQMKFIAWSFVNAIFSDRDVATQWKIVEYSASECAGIPLFVLALLSVYTQISFTNISILLFVILCFAKSALLYAAFRTFWGTGVGVFHIIMYFCALEIIPLMLLWRVAMGFFPVI